jgi:CBS domain-containing protein
MKVSDIMTPSVVSVQPDTTVVQAVRLMLQHEISGLAVVDKNGDLVGIVTEGDFLRRSETGTQKRRSRWLQFLIGPGKLADEYVHAKGRKVEEVMTRTPHTVRGDTPLADAVEMMEKYRVKRLPVVDGRKVIGIVSRANFLHALVSVALDVKAPALDDAGIREKLMAELATQKWVAPGMLNVMVRDGVVDLWGTILDERTRSALIVAAENVPGVKRVVDHLVWVEPMSGMAIVQDDDLPPQARAS